MGRSATMAHSPGDGGPARAGLGGAATPSAGLDRPRHHVGGLHGLLRTGLVRSLVLLLAASVLLFQSAVRAEEDPEISAKISTNELYFGEDLTLQIVEQDVEHPVRPDMTPLEDAFAVQEAGDQSLNQSSVMIINGRRTEHSFFGHVYQYRITPKQSGNVTVPAVTVTLNGKTYSTQPLSLRVIAPEKQDVVLAEIVTTPAKVYPTQPFDVTLRVLVRPLPDQARRDPLTPLRRQPPRLRINWVDPVPDGLTAGPANEWLGALQAANGVGFTINDIGSNDVFAFFERSLAVFDLPVRREVRKDSLGADVNYFVYELKRTFVPDKAGTYTFGPANVKGTFVSGVRGGREYSGRQIYAIAPAQSIEVRNVPTPRPATFCGGIGTYSVMAQAAPIALRVGDPLALTLTFTRDAGAGSLEMLSAPDLRRMDGLTQDFDVADETPTGEIKGQCKKFVYTLRPRRTGVGIPALTVSVFDPESEGFKEIATSPIELKVTEASKLMAGDLVASDRSSSAAAGVQLRSRAEGIFQNVTSVAQIGNQRVSPRMYLIASAILVFGYLLLWSSVLVWRRISSDPAWQRRQAARGRAEQGVRQARALLTEGKNEDALRALRGALTGMVADMLNLPAAGMTVQEAAGALRSSGIDEATCLEAGRMLEILDALEYGAKSSGELNRALDAAEKLLPVLYKELSERK